MHPGLEGSVKEKHKYSDLGKERGGGLQVGVPRGGGDLSVAGGLATNPDLVCM